MSLDSKKTRISRYWEGGDETFTSSTKAEDVEKIQTLFANIAPEIDFIRVNVDAVIRNSVLGGKYTKKDHLEIDRVHYRVGKTWCDFPVHFQNFDEQYWILRISLTSSDHEGMMNRELDTESQTLEEVRKAMESYGMSGFLPHRRMVWEAGQLDIPHTAMLIDGIHGVAVKDLLKTKQWADMKEPFFESIMADWTKWQRVVCDVMSEKDTGRIQTIGRKPVKVLPGITSELGTDSSPDQETKRFFEQLVKGLYMIAIQNYDSNEHDGGESGEGALVAPLMFRLIIKKRNVLPTGRDLLAFGNIGADWRDIILTSDDLEKPKIATLMDWSTTGYYPLEVIAGHYPAQGDEEHQGSRPLRSWFNRLNYFKEHSASLGQTDPNLAYLCQCLQRSRGKNDGVEASQDMLAKVFPEWNEQQLFFTPLKVQTLVKHALLSGAGGTPDANLLNLWDSIEDQVDLIDGIKELDYPYAIFEELVVNNIKRKTTQHMKERPEIQKELDHKEAQRQNELQQEIIAISAMGGTLFRS